MILLIIFAIVVVVAFLGVFLLLRMGFSGAHSFIKSKSKTVQAKILSKRKQDMLRSSGPYTNYFIWFSIGESDKIELPVNKRLYKKAHAGKTGILTYKGGLFISFIFDEDIKKEPKKETYILNGEIVEKDY